MKEQLLKNKEELEKQFMAAQEMLLKLRGALEYNDMLLKSLEKEQESGE